MPELDLNKFMAKAIKLALKANNQTEPNPIVGSLLVDEHGKILTKGYHKKAGAPHAEVEALKQFITVPENSTLFITLEPCCHYGKTPPCTEMLLKKKVRNLVVGTLDPNPQVAGKGIEFLKNRGVKVVTGILENQCLEINRVFNKHIVHKIPFIAAKAAITLDGKIAMPSGESQWITGEKARAEGHLLRSQFQAIAIGNNTLKIDNPQLTDRVSKKPRQPSLLRHGKL